MAPLLNTLQTNPTLRSASRFLVVGMLGTLLDFSLFAILHLLIGVPGLLANTLSYSAGILNNYLFHRRWTYAHRPGKSTARQFSQFAGVSLSALLFNNLMVLFLAPAFGGLLSDQALGAILAKIFAIGVGMSWNFLANHLWTFRAAPEG